MTFGKLYGIQNNPRTLAALVAAKANNVDIELVHTVPRKTDEEYLKINRTGKIPSFVGSDGFIVSECIAICIYITSQNEKTTLLGKTKQDYASILKWISYSNSDLAQAFTGWLWPHYGIAPYFKKLFDDSLLKSYELSKVFEEHLLNNTFLVGERLTLADIFCVSLMTIGFKYIFDKKWRLSNPCTTRWYTMVYNQPAFSAIADELAFIDEVFKFQLPKKDNQPKSEIVSKETDPKKESAPKKDATPKKKGASNNKEDEELEPVEPKPKHPLESLPKPSLPLDEWKRQYSNNETADALKWFWDNFNPDEYSLWKLEYKYNDELTHVFMSSNLIGGFFARLEASRKYIFGAASVYGTKEKSIIQGAFVIRGHESSPAFNVAPDSDSYEITKLDSNKDEDKQFVNDQWTWEKPITVDGTEYPWADGKVFK